MVMSVKRIVLAVVVVSLPCLAQGADKAVGPEVILEPQTPGRGEIMLVTVKNAVKGVEGKFNGKKIYFNPSHDSFKAMVGINLYAKPGKYNLALSVDGKKLRKTVVVKKKHYPLQRLTLPKDMVTLSRENAARVRRDARKFKALWPGETKRVWAGTFMNPLEGEVRSRFGLRRIINDIPKSSHTGVDVSGDMGAEVRAPNDGVAVLVDDMYYSGISLVLDHGQGIYTMFFHLSKITAKSGQNVKKGEVVGLVGSTGRSTGPHLHWGVRMQGARVDPVELLKLDLE
ncbi:MAG TPA: peptidase M23 [Nitrospiraceae bacterium]|nr:peptidase M23 [Nitrospiraceae bacterium]